MSRSIMVVAGEPSGDMNAAGVVRAVREQDASMHVFGIGGEALVAAGAEILHPIDEMAVFGPFAVIRRYPHFRKVFDDMVRVAGERKPDVALLVDYGGFNLRFAKQLKRLGIKVLYYVSPQVWASRRHRIAKMAEVVDRLMVIFPFEPEVYAETSLRVDFVGHPLVDAAAAAREAPLADLSWPGDTRVALLPGSRRQEVARILPVMLAAAARLHEAVPSVGFLVAASSDEMAATIQSALRGYPDLSCRVLTGSTRQILRQARAAWVTSGTATVEAALMRCPMTVVYKMSPLFHTLGKALVRVPYIGMVNILAGRELCPELIQGNATSESLVEALQPLLDDTTERQAMLAGLDEVARTLGPGGAAEKAASIVLEETT